MHTKCSVHRSHHVPQTKTQTQTQAQQSIDESRRTWMGNCFSVPFKVFNEMIEEKNAIEHKTPSISKIEAFVQGHKLDDDVFIEVRNSANAIYLISGDNTI